MEFSRSKIRTLSILGQRGAFGVTLTDLAADEENIVALTADLCNTSGLDRFNSAYPERLYNVGIAEQNMIGIAAGLAAGGNIPFATTFSNFAALRSCEQVRHFMGYMNENVKLVGFGAGFAMGMFGTTHYGVEDIASIRAINNITILSPADGLETAKAVIAASKMQGPVYIRLSGVMNIPVVYKEDYDFEIGRAVTVSEAEPGQTDITIFATGMMVSNSLKAAEMLREKGHNVRVIDVHSIKPIDYAAVEASRDSRLIVSVEEHSTIGGLGAAIAEILGESGNAPAHLRIGTKNTYLPAGSFEYMIEQHGLTPQGIYDQILTKTASGQ